MPASSRKTSPAARTTRRAASTPVRRSRHLAPGPVIEEGFYYDIATEKPFTPEDVAAIEARMKELIAQDYDVIKIMTPRAETIKIFQDRGEEYNCA